MPYNTLHEWVKLRHNVCMCRMHERVIVQSTMYVTICIHVHVHLHLQVTCIMKIEVHVLLFSSALTCTTKLLFAGQKGGGEEELLAGWWFIRVTTPTDHKCNCSNCAGAFARKHKQEYIQHKKGTNYSYCSNRLRQLTHDSKLHNRGTNASMWRASNEKLIP